MVRRPLALPLALVLAAAAIPAHALEGDRFVLRVGALSGEGRLDVAGGTTFLGQPRRYSERFETGRETIPTVHAQLRFGERHRLVFNHSSFDVDESGVLDEPIAFGTTTIPAGTTARGEADLRLTGLAYDFAVVETPTVSAGLQLGVQQARLSGRIRAQSGASVYDESDSENTPLPVLGARLTFAPQPAWRIDTQVQHVDAGWAGSDDFDGSLTMAHALAEYRFGARFGVHAGYQWMRVDIEDRENGGDGVDSLDLRFDGPVVGLTLAF